MSRTDTAPQKKAAATPADTSRSPGVIMTHRQILFVIYGLMAGMFLSALDQTVVGTSIRTIADDLDGLSQQAWVTTAYLIVSTIATPIYGKLSDIFGRRSLFIIAIVIFLIGSVFSGTSTSILELAGFRAIQGLGAGGLMALPLAIMGDMLAPRERAKYQGYFLAVFGISSVIGPLIGGLFAGAPFILGITGWRWVFLVNIPIGAIALYMVWRFLHLPKRSANRSVRIDWWGATTVIASVGPLLLVAEQGRTWGWASTESISCYIIGGLGILAFIMVEKMMKDDALIPLKLFRSPTFSMATILGVLVGFGMFGALSTVPLYLQIVKGSTPTESGFQLLPMILGLMISSIASGQLISRTGRYKIFPIIGTGLMMSGFLVFTTITADTPYWVLGSGMLLVGLGLGQLMQTLTIASQNAVGPRDIGVATSSSTFFRQVGGTLGVAVIFSVVFSRVPILIKGAFSDQSLVSKALKAAADPAVRADAANAGILKIYDPILKAIQSGGNPSLGNTSATTSLDGNTSFLTGANHALAAPFLQGFSGSMVTGFQVSLVIVAIAFVLSFFLKATPLRQKSAQEEVADADALLASELAAAGVERDATDAALVTGSPLVPTTGGSTAQTTADVTDTGTPAASDGASDGISGSEPTRP